MGELVSSGAISAERAESVGIPVGNLEPLAVESVTVPNLMQLKVTFNAGVTLKSASEPNNYAVYAGRSRIDIVVANLQPDGRTVILTLDKAVSQNELLDLTVRNIRGINGDRISREEYNGIECIDILSPKVEKIEVLGEDTIAVTFNEPVEAGNKYLYEVNRGDIPVKRVIEQDNYTKFILILEHEPETSKISLRISGNVKDMAGFNLIPVTYDVDMEN
ncbi:MAG: SwmB domain-containing protein [Acetivibrionales bacterium]